MIPYNCPGCGLTFNLPDDRAGKVAKCRCGMKGLVVGAAKEAEPQASVTVVRPKNALELHGSEFAFLFIAVIVLLSAAAVWVAVDGKRSRDTADHDKVIAQVQITPLVRLAEICESHVNGQTSPLAFEAELRQFAASRPQGNFERQLAEAGIARLMTARSVVVAAFLYEAADEQAGKVAKEYETSVERRKSAKRERRPITVQTQWARRYTVTLNRVEGLRTCSLDFSNPLPPKEVVDALLREEVQHEADADPTSDIYGKAFIGDTNLTADQWSGHIVYDARTKSILTLEQYRAMKRK
jgi:hypothetical protein